MNNEEQELAQASMEPIALEVPTGEDEEAARKRAREFDDALYAALLSRAHGDQARALVDALTALVTQHELAASSRTRRRGRTRTAVLRAAVERFLADLLQAQSVERPRGYVYRPMRPKGFTGGPVSYRTFKSVVDAMDGLGLLETNKGFQVWTDGFGAPGPYIQKATRFRATTRLLDLAEEHGVPVINFDEHFIVPPPEHPLLLRAASKRTEDGCEPQEKTDSSSWRECQSRKPAHR